MLSYSKSFRCSLKSQTENLYDRARKKLTSSFRGGEKRTRLKHAEQYVIVEDFTATEEGQLTVKNGQRVEVLDRYALTDNHEFVAVAIVDDESRVPGQRRGCVPVRILAAASDSLSPDALMSPIPVGADGSSPSASTANTSRHKRTSLRRFFNSSSNRDSPSASSTPRGANNCSSSANRLSSSSTPGADQQQPSGSLEANGSSSTNDENATTPCVLSATAPRPSASAGQPSRASEPRDFAAMSNHCANLTPMTTADLDLPPPMNQLSSVMGGNGDINMLESSSGAGCSTPTMNETGGSVGQQLSRSGDDDNSSPAPQDEHSGSAAGTPQEGAPAGGIAAQMTAEENAKMKRGYVLKELVETERAYVQDLTSVVEGYIANLSSMELPEDLQGKDKIIFANIAQILDFHKTIFLKEIEKCLVDYEAAGNAFVKYERRLNTYYVKYCQNKPKSDFLVSQDSFEQFFAETKQQLGHKVALCDLLIKPVQRITKYQLMLADILKYTQRAKDRTEVLAKALEVMKVVPKACDDMMQVGRLQNFEGNLTAQGRLLFQGTLQISDGGPAGPFRGKERRVFLFEQSAIIADCIAPRKEYGNPTYIFKNQIMVNKMVLQDNVTDEPLRFVLTSNDPSSQTVFVAQALSMDDKEKWLQKLSAQLDQQKTFLAALVDPKKYQNQLASSVGALSLSGKKDSSSSLGTPTGNGSGSGGSTSPKHHTVATATKSSSKLFGFGKSKS